MTGHNRYDEGFCNEVAMIFVGKDGQLPIERDVVLYSKHEKPMSIPQISKHRSHDIFTHLSKWRLPMDA